MGEMRGCCSQVHLAHEKSGLEDQLSVLLVTTQGYLPNSNYNTSVLDNNKNTQFNIDYSSYTTILTQLEELYDN